MERIKREQSLTIAADASESTVWPVDDMSFGCVQLPASMTGTALAIEGRLADSGDWFPVTDPAGVELTIPFVASSIVRIPDAAFGCRALRLVSNDTEAEARTINTLAKS